MAPTRCFAAVVIALQLAAALHKFKCSQRTRARRRLEPAAGRVGGGARVCTRMAFARGALDAPCGIPSPCVSGRGSCVSAEPRLPFTASGCGRRIPGISVGRECALHVGPLHAARRAVCRMLAFSRSRMPLRAFWWCQWRFLQTARENSMAWCRLYAGVCHCHSRQLFCGVDGARRCQRGREACRTGSVTLRDTRLT